MLLNTLILGMKNNVQVCTYSFFEPIKHCYKALINFLRKYTRLNYLCSFHALVYELKVIFHTLQLACEAQHLMSYHFFVGVGMEWQSYFNAANCTYKFNRNHDFLCLVFFYSKFTRIK